MNKITQWHLDDELVLDFFAGGGGASTGIEMALGRPVNIAVNHDDNAIKMHTANHPHTRHLCEDVFAVDPESVCKGRRVALAWFSPDCTHHSKAKGGKPRSKKIRGLAWVVIKWMARVRPRVVCLENVEEFRDWGPLTKDGQPCKARKGKIFDHWISQMERLGYKVEYWVLRGCDYGVPTIRKRLFLVARCDGLPIVKPTPTHGDPKSDAVKKRKLKPWPVAADIIDWSLPCPSIFMAPDEAKKRRLKRPLAENTMKRIARGLQKFVFDAADPFVVTVNHGGDTFRGQGIDQPFNTVTAARDGHGVVQPYLAELAHGEASPDGKVKRWGKGIHALDKPLGTVTASSSTKGLVQPFVQHVQHSSSPTGTMPVDEPLRTVTATPKGGGMALSCAYLSQHNNTSADSRSADAPLSTVTNTGSQQGLIAAHVTKFRNGATGHAATDPLATVTSGGKMTRPGGANPLGVVSSNLIKLRGTCQHGQPVTEPVPTVTAGGFHLGEVRAFLMKYYGTGEGQVCDDPLGTVTSKERFGLVTIKGEEYQIVDIGMRMLTPRELYAAQGFPADYKIGDNPEADGFKFSKSQQVAKCGNSVCPPLAAAIVRANVKPTSLFAPANDTEKKETAA
ncbi:MULTISPECIES: DNA cytosine methyltransferase [unclassified Thalassospira]|uniref:DNA cytosine methyltransferase n=1 Tax=unclassified Thalassospira TaxID=2648997 RepID=UPI0007A606D7|nr:MULTISPECIES: DNA cytosine methyltransferase [unclassified Thalassospira]KZC99728.1 hypothetical protein AUQ41_08610 [Thalassospira sp. MCCC 1A02898]ONH85342.1 hypothetical protein TH47_05725 [Thalassospira sp. MCCC 1A02803]